MNEHIKLVFLANDNPIDNKNKNGDIDIIFEAIQKEGKISIPTLTVSNGENLDKINSFLGNIRESDYYCDKEIYHFDYFRYYIKNNYPYLYSAFKLDNPRFDTVRDSNILLLLKLLEKLTEIGFMSFLNSDLDTFIYIPKRMTTDLQKEKLDSLKSYFDENQRINLFLCSTSSTEHFSGGLSVIDDYLNSVGYKKDKVGRK